LERCINYDHFAVALIDCHSPIFNYWIELFW